MNVLVGRFATINMHCQAAHDAVLADFATLHPGARLAGNALIGEGTEVGTAAAVLPGDATYVGLPARVLRRRPAVARRRQGAA